MSNEGQPENLEACLIELGKENWRNISNSIVYVRSADSLDVLNKAGFEVDSRNDGFIGLCFVDHLQGLSFYVIAAAHIRNNNIFISKENKSAKLIFRAQALEKCLYLNQNYMNMDFLRLMNLESLFSRMILKFFYLDEALVRNECMCV